MSSVPVQCHLSPTTTGRGPFRSQNHRTYCWPENLGGTSTWLRRLSSPALAEGPSHTTWASQSGGDLSEEFTDGYIDSSDTESDRDWELSESSSEEDEDDESMALLQQSTSDDYSDYDTYSYPDGDWGSESEDGDLEERTIQQSAVVVEVSSPDLQDSLDEPRATARTLMQRLQHVYQFARVKCNPVAEQFSQHRRCFHPPPPSSSSLRPLAITASSALVDGPRVFLPVLTPGPASLPHEPSVIRSGSDNLHHLYLHPDAERHSHESNRPAAREWPLERADTFKIGLLSFRIETALKTGNGLFKLVRARSVERRFTDCGPRENSVWALKLSNFEEGAGTEELKRKRRMRITRHYQAELAAYQRISQTDDLKKHSGYQFLLGLEASLILGDRIAMVYSLMPMDLTTFIQSGRMIEGDIPRMSSQIAIGLATLHSIGIMHRDLKPDNVLVDLRGNVKICDFGLAYVLRHASPFKLGDLCPERGMIGTDPYMAPEMFVAGRSYGPSADWFSFGCLLWEMVSLSAAETLFLFPSRSPKRTVEEWCQKWSENSTDNADAKANYLGVEHLLSQRAAFDLLLGLLYPHPLLRFGIKDMLASPFFITKSGSCYFSEEMMMGFLDSPIRFSIADAPSQDTDAPAAKTVTWHRVFSHTEGSWINPIGGFFEDAKQI